MPLSDDKRPARVNLPIDGPVAPLGPPEAGVVAAMATVLRDHDETATDAAAIRCLMNHGFRSGDIVALLDDVLFEARQAAVSDTMARSR